MSKSIKDKASKFAERIFQREKPEQMNEQMNHKLLTRMN